MPTFPDTFFKQMRDAYLANKDIFGPDFPISGVFTSLQLKLNMFGDFTGATDEQMYKAMDEVLEELRYHRK